MTSITGCCADAEDDDDDQDDDDDDGDAINGRDEIEQKKKRFEESSPLFGQKNSADEVFLFHTVSSFSLSLSFLFSVFLTSFLSFAMFFVKKQKVWLNN